MRHKIKIEQTGDGGINRYIVKLNDVTMKGISGGICYNYTLDNMYLKIGWHADREIERWPSISYYDRRYFAKVVQIGSSGTYKYIIKLDVGDCIRFSGYEDKRLKDVKKAKRIMRQMASKYSISDMHYGNWGVYEDTGWPVIWDWGG